MEERVEGSECLALGTTAQDQQVVAGSPLFFHNTHIIIIIIQN